MPADQHGDPFENRLSAALRQAGGTFDSPRTGLSTAGAARGRRMQLQRRATIAGSTAALALVGVGGALLVPWDGAPAPRPSSVAATGSGTKPAYSADDVVRTLQKLLPKGKFGRTAARGTGEGLPPLAVGVFDDGKGEGSVSVGLDRIPADAGEVNPSAAVMPCPDGEQTGLDSCRTELLSDGSALTVYQGYEYPDRREDTKAWGADLVTPAGHHVSVVEWNAAAEKGKPVSRPEPPLTTAQLKTLATAAEWRRIIAAVPEESVKPAPSAPRAEPDVPSRRMLSVLRMTLPEKLKIVSSGGQEGFAYAVVDDGKGESYLQVNLQLNMSDAAGRLYGSDAETLPDGTRVATRQGPGEKGGEGVVMWTADTMRSDGRRVVISAFNASSQSTAATRPAPPLTVAQLRKIALSPDWDVLGG
ncbi:hypothetical protein [Streptomyces rishiriensis]|uniref:Uncharacterized protein n=1 Tax=Streptomyces rishiriensis TaxID=68264 RepID=A0ABU0NVG4_STRRH|nr:hypothetical protein [Streptomyces rishiriensis]MDQ0583157.1 hypothetical protein [Streptomyces rishiriensis]